MTTVSSIAAPKAAAPLRARRAANAPTVRAPTIRCAANNDGSSSSRRDALLQLASLAAAPALLTPTQPAAANVASIYKYEPVDALPPAILDSGNAKVPIAAALRAQTVYAGYAVPIIEKNVTVPLGTLISLAARDAGEFFSPQSKSKDTRATPAASARKIANTWCSGTAHTARAVPK